jgi:hypothetical protein
MLFHVFSITTTIMNKQCNYKILSLIAVTLLCFSTSKSFTQDSDFLPLYHFLGGSSDLTNKGAVGGSADFYPLSGNLPYVTSDAVRKADVLVFPPSATQFGSWLEFPDSTDKFRLSESGQEMTLSAWIRWNGPLPDINRQCIATTMGPAQKEGWSLSIDRSGRLIFNWQLPNGLGGARFNLEGLEIGQWTHIALVWRNDSTDGLVFYINGLPVASEGGPGGGPLIAGDEPIRFGAFTNGKENGYAPLNAAVANIVFYDIALDENAISNLIIVK